MNRAKKPLPEEAPTRPDIRRAKQISGVHKKPEEPAVNVEVEATKAEDRRRED